MRKNYNKNQITCPLATRVPVNAGPGDPEETFLVLSASWCKHFEQYRDHSYDQKSISPPPGAGPGGKFQGLVRGSGLEPGAPAGNKNNWGTWMEEEYLVHMDGRRYLVHISGTAIFGTYGRKKIFAYVWKDDLWSHKRKITIMAKSYQSKYLEAYG